MRSHITLPSSNSAVRLYEIEPFHSLALKPIPLVLLLCSKLLPLVVEETHHIWVHCVIRNLWACRYRGILVSLRLLLRVTDSSYLSSILTPLIMMQIDWINPIKILSQDAYAFLVIHRVPLRPDVDIDIVSRLILWCSMVPKGLSSCFNWFFATVSLYVFVILVVHETHSIVHLSVLQIAMKVSLTKSLLRLLLQHNLHLLIEIWALSHDILFFFHRLLVSSFLCWM